MSLSYIYSLVNFLSFVAGSILLSIIIFGANYDTDESLVKGYNIGWSFGMSVVAAIIALVGGALLTVDLVQNPTS